MGMVPRPPTRRLDPPVNTSFHLLDIFDSLKNKILDTVLFSYDVVVAHIQFYQTSVLMS